MSLFRFSKKRHLQDFMDGKVSFGHWSIYKDDALAEGQIDEENIRIFNPDVKRNPFFMDGQPIRGLKNVEIKLKIKDCKFYILSLSTEYNEDMYTHFECDACIEIVDEIEFASRVNDKMDEIGLGGLRGPITYYSKENLLHPVENYRDLIFCKENKYLYQKEYRFVAIADFGQYGERLTLDVGSLDKICRMKS